MNGPLWVVWLLTLFILTLMPARISNWCWSAVAAGLFIWDGSWVAFVLCFLAARDAVRHTPPLT
ncbi:hypothetical protein [Bradyrhizobium erythrophlei]|uniref:Uncharacterized protein n=1 Tax=Bradyrhizobium erythrophlei TaxID=1437360 RepID=A0A1M5NGC2_9BRAD|nr:hypothetical protein [Bradyrhizobium erythrophlei]SHG88560.1 hypothetical protein SAMN05443248_2985 [Bradyrhizobium erythrophlei]